MLRLFSRDVRWRRFRCLTCVVVLALATAGCSTDDGAVGPPPQSDQPAESVNQEQPDKSLVEPDDGEGGEVDSGSTSEPIADGFELVPVAEATIPITGAVDPNSDLTWIGEQGGAIRVFDGSELSEPVLDLSDRTTAEREQGLLGMAFSPSGSHLYVHYSDSNGDTTIAEFPVEDSVVDDTERIVLSVSQPFANHNGGEILFGPDDYLYIGLGDGGSAGDPEGNGQNRQSLLGSILRIDPQRGDPYAIPADNPFVGNDNARDEIWAYGLRNPFRMSFDDDGSLWVGDVGQNEFEEISRIQPEQAGMNLGWNLVEGDSEFAGEAPPDHLPPTLVYGHDGRCSVTGGLVYRGTQIPELTGAYLYSDFCQSELRAFDIDDPSTDRSLDLNPSSGVTAFVETADQEVLVLTIGGTIFALQ